MTNQEAVGVLEDLQDSLTIAFSKDSKEWKEISEAFAMSTAALQVQDRLIIKANSEKLYKKYDGIADALTTVLGMINDIPITGDNTHVSSGQREMKSLCIAAVMSVRKEFEHDGL